MTELAAAACPWWWPRGLTHDFVADEIVGPDAVADLVGVRFDQRRLAARETAGIAPVVDVLALQALTACRNRVMSTQELALACHVTPSGIRRALAVADEAGAILRQGRGRYATHPAWSPIGARLVAVELKLDNWRAAFTQAEAYARWANATWVVLGRRPQSAAVTYAQREGIGLAVLATDGNIKRLVRPRAVRKPALRWAALWASEQALARAISAGYRSEFRTAIPPRTTARPATPAAVVAASLQSA